VPIVFPLPADEISPPEECNRTQRNDYPLDGRTLTLEWSRPSPSSDISDEILTFGNNSHSPVKAEGKSPARCSAETCNDGSLSEVRSGEDHGTLHGQGWRMPE
jgi:hypothetical protein